MSTMTRAQASEWVLRHWTADEDGTDLDWEALLDAHEGLLGRLPGEDEDALGNLRRHIRSILAAAPANEPETKH